MSISEIFSLIIVFILSFFGVEIFRRWCIKHEIFDIPNDRSSHTTPTARGGGIIIVALSLVFYITYELIYGNINWYYVAGALIIAIISWLDDLISIRSIWRFAVHSLAAFVAIFGIGNIHFDIFYLDQFAWLQMLITFVWIVWLTNAYNFMDGIDGIAATQAITAGIGWFLFGFYTNETSISYFAAVLVTTNLGFIFHNWSPAKIFMGDVGSAFLGYTFAVIPLLFIENNSVKNTFTFAIFAVFLFLFDSILTFLRRVINREKFWEAHRSHIYQRLVISGFSHQKVTLLYGVLSFIVIGIYFLIVNLR